MDELPFLQDVINVLAEASHIQDASNSRMGLKKMGTRERVVRAMRCEGDSSVSGEVAFIQRWEPAVSLQTVHIFGRLITSECGSPTRY
jgi:hypothetical protein